jgi:heparin/heparan-sulfate lyase
MILAAELLFTATEGRLNLYTDANPFFSRYIPFTLFVIRPDFTYPHWSDIENFSPQYSRDLRENILPLTFRFSSGLGQYLLSKLEKNYGYQSMYEVLWKRDAPAAARPDKAYTSNPGLSALFRGVGLAIMRTGFTPDDAYVSFKASHWLSSHVHADAGHFEIFKNGPLVIDSGSYDEWGSRHMRNYYARTIAHNTLTIFDPDEPLSDFSDYVNDGGQLYWDHNVFSTSQEGVKGIMPGAPFHAATIQNYVEHADFTYVCADLTSAYSSGKISNVDRQLFYFPHGNNALIVIIDRITVTNRRFPVSFLLHYDGTLAVSRNVFVVSNGVSKLYGKVLLPTDAALTQRGPYEVGTTSYPPSVEYPESGKGRLEIRYSSQESKDLYFITVLSVDQQVPAATVQEGAETISVEFTYAGKPMRISTNRSPQPLASNLAINGRKVSLESGALAEASRP